MPKRKAREVRRVRKLRKQGMKKSTKIIIIILILIILGLITWIAIELATSPTGRIIQSWGKVSPVTGGAIGGEEPIRGQPVEGITG